MADCVGMTKSDIGGVIGPETRAAHRDSLTQTFAARQIEHVAHDHIFVGIMRAHPIRGMNRFVVETFEIDRVRAIDRDFACIDIAANGTDESEVFVLVIPAERRGKQNQREPAAVAESEHLKLPAQIRRPPFDIAFIHFQRSGAGILVAVHLNRKPEACATFHLQRCVSPCMSKHTLTGKIKRHRGFRSKILGNRRDVLVYLPRGYRRFSRRRYPVLYLQDGQNVFDAATSFASVEWGVDETAEQLIQKELIEPLIIVAIANTGKDRIHEYAPSPSAIFELELEETRSRGLGRDYGRVLIEELKPYIDKKYRTQREAEFTGLGGSSSGGYVTMAPGCRVAGGRATLVVRA